MRSKKGCKLYRIIYFHANHCLSNDVQIFRHCITSNGLKKSAHNWPRFKLSPKCLTKPGSAPVPIFCSCKSSLQELWTSWTLLTISQGWRNVTKTKSWSTFETKALLSNQWSSSDPNPGSNWTSMSCVFLSPYLNLVLKGYHLWGMWVTSVHSLEKWWYL